MKKITLLILLMAFQITVFAQADVTSSVLTNPGFEAATFDTDWTLVQNKGVATFTDAGSAEASSGDHAGLVEVTVAQGIWELFLERTLNTTGFSDTELEISFKTKRLWTTAGAAAGKVQLWVGESGGANLVPSGHNGGNNQQWYDATAEGVYEDVVFNITVPTDVTELVMQLWVGGNLGSYFFDEFTVVDVNATTASVDDFAQNAIKMYPNPTNGRLSFDNITDIQKIEVLDAHGKTVRTVNNQNSIDIESLTPGVYFARIGLPNDHSVVKKVIKN